MSPEEVTGPRHVYVEPGPSPWWAHSLTGEDCFGICSQADSFPAWFLLGVLSRCANILEASIARAKYGDEVALGGFNGQLAPLRVPPRRRTTPNERDVPKRRPAPLTAPLVRRPERRGRAPRTSHTRRPLAQARGPDEPHEPGGDEPPPEQLNGPPVFEILVPFEGRPVVRLWALHDEDERRMLVWIESRPELWQLLDRASEIAQRDEP